MEVNKLVDLFLNYYRDRNSEKDVHSVTHMDIISVEDYPEDMKEDLASFEADEYEWWYQSVDKANS